MLYIERFGTEYGGYFYPADLVGLDSSSTIYCLGAGEDISHDVLLAGYLGSKVHIFDPTPRAINHFKQVQELLSGNNKFKIDPRVGGGDPNYYSLIANSGAEPQNILFHPYAVADSDGTANFYFPQNPEHVSCSLIPGFKSDKCIEVECKCIRTIMKELHHTHIDLLKVDIEGMECVLINQLFDLDLKPKYISVDYDTARLDGKGRLQVNAQIQRILHSGYRIIHFHNYDVSFVKLER